MTKLYEVLTNTVESFSVEAESEDHAKRMFELGEVFQESDTIEDYKVISVEFLRELIDE